MANKPAAFPVFADAYLADTMHLTTEEHGAYLLLLMAAWQQDDCALPNDDRKLARITRLSPHKWRVLRETILEFWTVENGRIFQKRQRKEREWVNEKSRTNRENSLKGWEKKRLEDGDTQDIENKQSGVSERIANALPNGCEINAPPPPPPPKEEISAAKAADCPTASAVEPEPPANDDPPDEGLTPAHVMEFWNEIAPRIGKRTIRKLTPERRDLVKGRITQNALTDFQEVFANIRTSPFLRGDTGWRGCTFDWVFKKANFQKILEGNYNDDEPAQARR